MVNVFEALMVICFGMSWPLNIAKAWKSKSTKGISLLFYCFIWIGYVFGIASKIIKAYSENISFQAVSPYYVWFFYILNTIMVSIGIGIYFKNKSLEKSAAMQIK